jgi:hypothetical protein
MEIVQGPPERISTNAWMGKHNVRSRSTIEKETSGLRMDPEGPSSTRQTDLTEEDLRSSFGKSVDEWPKG